MKEHIFLKLKTMIEIFKTKEEFNQYNNGIKCGNIYYVEENNDVVFRTNNIDGSDNVYYLKSDEMRLSNTNPIPQFNTPMFYSKFIWYVAPNPNVRRSISLPFDLSDEEIENTFGYGTKLFVYGGTKSTYNEDGTLKQIDENTLIEITNLGEGIKASYPYVIKPTYKDKDGNDLENDGYFRFHNKVYQPNVKENSYKCYFENKYYVFKPLFYNNVMSKWDSILTTVKGNFDHYNYDGAVQNVFIGALRATDEFKQIATNEILLPSITKEYTLNDLGITKEQFKEYLPQ